MTIPVYVLVDRRVGDPVMTGVDHVYSVGAPGRVPVGDAGPGFGIPSTVADPPAETDSGGPVMSRPSSVRTSPPRTARIAG